MCDYDKRTAMHLAASEGHTELVKFLLNVGHVRVDPRDRWNRTTRDDAETFGYGTIVQLLDQAEQKVGKGAKWSGGTRRREERRGTVGELK